MSIITPRFMTNFVKLYEKANANLCDLSKSELKLDKIHESVFCVLLHNSIELIGK
jgi:hypothetical protein